MARSNSDVCITKKPPKRIIAIILTAVLLVLSGLVIVAVGNQTGAFYNDFSKVAYVNAEPIYVREFNMKLNNKSIEVLDYFKKKYGIENSNRFWTTAIDGQVPGEIAKQKALQELVRIKVQQIQAKEKGIIKSVDYKDFLAELKKENKSRADALKSNKIVYGPDEYSEAGYFSYTFDNMVSGLKEKLIKKELLISEEKLEESYELQKDTVFKIPDNIIVQRISVQFVDNKGIISEERKISARERIEDAKKRLNGGESFDSVARLYNKDDELLVHSFFSENQNKESEALMDILNEARKLEIGETSGIIERDKDYTIVKCIEREDMGFVPYEEARNIIENEILEKDYEKYIDELLEDTKVKINNKVYDRLNVN